MPARKRGQNGVKIQGNVSIHNGDFVGGDKTTIAKDGATYVGGNVRDSNIVTGDHNQAVNSSSIQTELFDEIFKKIEQRPQTSSEDREDLKTNVEEIKGEMEKGDTADESFLTRRLRNITRIAPDIADVVIATLANPVAGFSLIAKKVAEKASAH